MKLFIAMLFLVFMSVSVTAMADLQKDRQQADSLMQAGEEKQAFKIYRDLARSGDNDSQYKLSKLYARGQGTKKDMADAYGWSVVAAESGLEKLTEHSDSLLTSMDPKEQKKAEKKARSLVNKYGKEALAEKADRISQRNGGSRMGACTGSRIRCRGVISTSAPETAGSGQGMVDPAGG